MIQLITGSNARYLDKIRPYLNSLAQITGVSKRLCLVDCKPEPDYFDGLDLLAVKTPRTALIGSPPESESLQHGAWLPYVGDGGNDPVVIWTDGDIIVQRDLTDSERAGLETWPENTFGVSYNMGPHETLLHEALFKLHPRVSDGEFLNRWGRVTLEGICFNIGVMVARRSAYQQLYDSYLPLWDEIGQYLTHAARQQWLIGYLLHTKGFDLRILPYEFHTHYHFDLPSGALVTRAGEAYYQNQMVLFWHLPMHRRK